MSELNNTATSIGNYNSVPTSLTSNTSVVNMVEGLSLTKEADKDNWVSGYLIYTITLDNATDTTYEHPVITDVLDNTLVEFVNDSVTIDGVKAETSKYNYDEGSHTLTVNLGDVSHSGSTTLTFLVAKKA